MRMRGWIEAVSNQGLQRIEPDGARWDMDMGWEITGDTDASVNATREQRAG